MTPTRSVGLLTLAIAALFSTFPAHAARLALVVGNDSYSQVTPLKNARNDARLVAGVLRKAGFEVSEASNLNRTALWSTLDRFKGRIQKGDEVVFYFAGHGVQVGANQLLLPTDISADNDSQVQRDGVPLIDVQDALKDARLAMLLIDACRDNPFPKTGTRSVGSTRGLSPPEASTGQIIMMSAGRNQKALDYVPNSAQANGLFAWELSQVLQTPGLEIRNALEDVKNRVDDKARRAGHEQRPSLVNDLRGSFYLSSGPAVQVASLKPEPVSITPQPGQASSMSLDDLEKEEASRRKWVQWQAQMKADFDKTAVFNGSADLQVKAWERYIAAWSQDNPLSREDEDLRSQAQNRRDKAQQIATSNAQQYRVSPPADSGRIASLSGTLRKIKESGTVTMGVRESSSVLSFNRGSGQYEGFHVELCQLTMEELKQQLGLPRLDVRYQVVTSQNRIPLVQNGTVDIECGSTTKNAARQRDVAFAVTTFVDEVRMAVKSDSGITSFSQLNGKNVAATTGTTSLNQLKSSPYGYVAINEVFGKDHSDAFLLLEAGRADAFIMDSLILAGNIATSRNPSRFRIVGEPLRLEPMAIMIRKDDLPFKQAIDRILSKWMASGEMERIYNKWFSRLALPVNASTRSAWLTPNDTPVEELR